MITTIVQLLIAFPKLGRLFLDVRKEYVKEIKNRRHSHHSDVIDEWVRDGKGESTAVDPPATEQPRL